MENKILFNGQKLTLKKDADLDNIVIDGISQVGYSSTAKDAEGREYEILWHLCEDYAQALERIKAIEDDPYYDPADDLAIIDDTEEACDWDNPTKIIPMF